MRKEVGAYPECAQCLGFVAPDATSGVMTWEELLECMDNLIEWGQEMIKGWKKMFGWPSKPETSEGETDPSRLKPDLGGAERLMEAAVLLSLPAMGRRSRGAMR